MIKIRPKKPINFLITPLFLIIFSSLIGPYSINALPSGYYIPDFWSESENYYYRVQITNVTCISASIQMILLSVDVESLPTQESLANEMLSDENHTVRWEYTWIPFSSRNYSVAMNDSLASISDVAIFRLKQYIVNDSRVMVATWFSEADKENRDITHARVITGYNETGIFYHDPLIGPNRFSYYSDFIELWNTDLGYWALVVRYSEVEDKTFNFSVWLEDNFDIVMLLVMGILVEVHYISRLSNFTNSVALYLFFSRNNINNIILELYVILGIILGIIGLASYLLKESLPSEYYEFCLLFYNSVSIAVIMIFYNIFIL